MFEICLCIIFFLGPLCIIELLFEHTSEGRNFLAWLSDKLGFSEPSDWL